MLLRQAADTSADGGELPRLVRLGDGLYGAAFQLMKLLPARYIMDRAEEAGAVRPGTTVLETSSGTFGLGLAIVCRLRGYDLVVVGDPAIDAGLRWRLAELGARVTIVSAAAGRAQGVQQARLARLERLRARYPDHYVPGQYDNPMNAVAYGTVAELLVESLGHLDCIVGPVGSGGSTRGLAMCLRALFPWLVLVGVDTPGSVLFGAPDGPRLLRGLGSGIHPRNVDHTLYDEVHWVGAAEAFLATRLLHRRHALFMGATSGAAYLVGRWWAAEHPGATVVALLPDEGHRYQRTVYHDAWLRRRGLLPAANPSPAEPPHPRTIEHPRDVEGGWTRIGWRRRTLGDVLDGQPDGR